MRVAAVQDYKELEELSESRKAIIIKKGKLQKSVNTGAFSYSNERRNQLSELLLFPDRLFSTGF